MSELILKAGREKSLLRRHPWVFSGAVIELRGEIDFGGTVRIVNQRGDFLAWGSYNNKSQIMSRVWSWDEDEQINADFFVARLKKSIEMRQGLGLQENPGGIRWVHGESDRLPGLIVDQYAQTLVVQFLSAGMEHWKDTICDALEELICPDGIFERSDVDVRKLEGLEPRTGVIRGKEPPDKVLIVENGVKFWVDVTRGHKTGFYLDQRENRAKVRKLAPGKDILDCFCYTGGFGINAAMSGAKSILSIDASGESLMMAHENYRLNNLEAQYAATEGDVFLLFRQFRDRNLNYDLIILDPPKFAYSTATVERAARGYKDINLLAFKLLRPGGTLVTFSCSGSVSDDLFQKIVAGAALDAGVEAKIVEHLHQAPDHPIALNFPEGSYLKGFIIRVN